MVTRTERVRAQYTVYSIQYTVYSIPREDVYPLGLEQVLVSVFGMTLNRWDC